MSNTLMFSFLLLLCFQRIEGIIYDYKDVNIPATSMLESTHGLYGAGEGISAYVRLSLSLRLHRPKGTKVKDSEELEIALLERNKQGKLETAYHCAPSGLKLLTPEASVLGEPSKKHLQRASVSDDHPTKWIHVEFPIHHSGKYTLVFARCHGSSDPVLINGSVEWLSEYGQLPGEYLRLLPFYGLVSAIYLIVGLLWLVRMHQFSESVQQIHKVIFFVLLFNFCETVLCFWNYASANETGRLLDTGSIFWTAEIFRVIADTICRTFLLLVCTGYGILANHLGTQEFRRVSVFTVVYFLLKLVDHLTAVTPASISSLLLVMDLGLMVWLFVSLSRAETQLQEKLDMAMQEEPSAELKLEMFKSTRCLLVFFLVVTALSFIGLWSMYDILPWTWEWIRHSFEDCIIFLVVFYFSIAWLPGEDSVQYAPIPAEFELGAMQNPQFGQSSNGPEV